MAAQAYDRPRSVEITSLYIEEEANDIRPFVVHVSIFEDMFSTFLTGQIIMVDYAGVYEKLKLQGWEKVVIGFKTSPDGEFDLFMKEFRIYKIANGSDSTSGISKRTYTLHLISEQAYNDMTTKISRSYKDMKESDIVESVAKNILKCPKIEVEPTKYTRSIVIPNMRPVMLIDRLSASAVRSEGSYEAVNYLFYENIESFYFVSLDKLMEQQPIEPPLTYQIVGAESGRKGFSRQMKRVQQREAVDLLSGSAEGAFGTKHIGVDTLHKKIQDFDYNYNDEFEKQVNIDGQNKRVSKNAPVSPEQRVLIRPFNSKLQGTASDNSEKYIMKRAAMMHLWNNYVLEAEVEGDTNLRLGAKIEVELPSYNSDEPGLDKELSGFYLITGIHHYFTNDSHNQVLTLRKPMLKGSENEE